jgi:hypothetical protein
MAYPNSTYTDVVTTTLESRTKKLQDNVTDNNAILKVLSEKGNIDPCPGGRVIVQELLFAENGNGGWYSGYDTLPTSPSDVISAAEFAWKQYACPVVMSGLEEGQNDGEEAVISLIKGRIKAAEATMANAIALGLYSDGTGSGGKTITGLDAAIPVAPTSGTYGGINRATWTFWQSQVVDPGTTPTVSTLVGHMTDLWAECVRGKNHPNLIMSDDVLWVMYMGALQPNARFTNAKMADAGFKNVEFMGVPVVLDGGIGGNATASTMYFLNTDFLHYRPHSRRNMVPIGKERVATNQDATVQIIGWMGNLTCSGAQFQGRLVGT